MPNEVKYERRNSNEHRHTCRSDRNSRQRDGGHHNGCSLTHKEEYNLAKYSE